MSCMTSWFGYLAPTMLCADAAGIDRAWCARPGVNERRAGLPTKGSARWVVGQAHGDFFADFQLALRRLQSPNCLSIKRHFSVSVVVGRNAGIRLISPVELSVSTPPQIAKRGGVMFLA